VVTCCCVYSSACAVVFRRKSLRRCVRLTSDYLAGTSGEVGCSDSKAHDYLGGDAGGSRSSRTPGATMQRGRAAPRQPRSNTDRQWRGRHRTRGHGALRYVPNTRNLAFCRP
jgi:hypothetical protein